MQDEVVNDNVITFSNTNPVPTSNAIFRFAKRFYKDRLTYSMCYSYGTVGSVTLGPDFLHFYLIFANRLGADGSTQGRTLAVTRRRKGVLGWLLNRVLLFASKLVGAYFARGDTRVFQTIKFDFKTPVKADRAIIRFIQHMEAQKTLHWGTWAATDDEATDDEATDAQTPNVRAIR